MAIGSIINTGTLTQTFDGEFNSGFISSPDGSTGLWRTSMMNTNRTLSPNGEQEYYSDSSVGYNPFSVQNGVLNINAQPTAVVGGNALGLPYDSGVITTEDSFSQLYGYFEIDAKLPVGQGLWPAFWLLPESGAWPPELDVFEVLGNDPSTLYFSTHSGVAATAHSIISNLDTSGTFNRYGVMWGPQTVDLYINNVEVASMPTPSDMNVPMYMLANLAVGGYWPGNPDGTTKFPADMQIASVKAFAYPGTTGGTVYDTLPSQNIGAAPTAPNITAPGSIAAGSGVTTSIGGVSIAANWPGGDFTVVVSDYSGLLHTNATNDVQSSGENTTALTLSGHLASINAALATLTYDGTPTGPDYLWIGATDPQGQQGTGSVVVNVGATAAPVVTAPLTLSATAGASQALSGIGVSDNQASGNVTLALSDGTGLLTTTATAGVTALGEGTKALTLTGALAAVNAELATLSYRAGAAAGSDQVAVTFSDAVGNHASTAVSVSVAAAQTGTAPAVTVPANFAATAGASQALSGISIADSAATGSVTAVLSDTAGLLSASAATGVTAQGDGTTRLTLTGSLAALNADLATLSYKAGASAGSDLLNISATANGVQGTGSAGITVSAGGSGSGTGTPVVTAPATASVAAGATVAIGGVSVADSGATSLSVTVSDSTGLLRTNVAGGLTLTGEGTTSLTLAGSLVAINADLASLSYQAGPSTGTDWLWVSASATNAPLGLNHTVVTTVPSSVSVHTPAKFSAVAGSSHALAGITVADNTPGVTVTAVLSDKIGKLTTATQAGVTASGEGTTTLTLVGSVAAINADLATLTYKAGSAAGKDALTVSATANGAHDPNTVPITVTAPPTPTPVVSTPAGVVLAAGATGRVIGVKVADSGAGALSVTVSDSNGLLHTKAASGLTQTGEGTTSLTLTGSLAAINANLVGLTYQAVQAATGDDWLWVSANSAGAPQGLNHSVVSVEAGPTATVTGLLTGHAETYLDGKSSITGTVQIDGVHVVRNIGTLAWNTGSIVLGSGDAVAAVHYGTLHNNAGGTIDIGGTGSVNSVGKPGEGTFYNAGMIVKSGGVTTVFAAFDNIGTVNVASGTLALEQAASGTGSYDIGAHATLDFASVVGTLSTVSFLQSPGTLEVHSAGTFGAKILGFAAGDMIDLPSVLPGASLNVAQSGTTDTLTIGGAAPTVFALQGNFAAGNFHLGADGHGGSSITYL